MAAAAVRIGSAVLTVIALCAGCAAPPPVQVTWDESEDLSRFRTWDWIEGDPVFVYAPFDAAGTEEHLSALVESALRRRGLARASEDPELRVAALLVGTRHIEVFRRARAMETLYSHHDIGGYEVQGEDVERRPIDRCRLAIYVTASRQEKLLWQAVSEQKRPGGCAAQLDAAVATLLESFPPPSPTAQR